MRAIVLNGFGSIEHLELTEINVPAILENEVLVEVKAIGINPVDVTTRVGNWLSPELRDKDPIILGWDISGIVRDSKSSLFQNGDQVFGMINFPGHGKAYAEYVAAPAGHLSLKPANISYEEAAAGCLAALTAYQSLHTHYQLKAGQSVLIHAAAGGVGHFAVQLAKQAGAYVIGISSEANRAFVFSIGADEHIDYHKIRFE
jgi:NADPH:quinone reductase-like Zn-dependent oxidoreductase